MTDKAIATLVDRLEAVAKRLEAVEGKIGSGGSGGASKSSGGGNAGSSAGEDSQSVVDFDELVRQFIDPWVATSNKLGGEIAEIAPLYREAVDQLRGIIVGATQAKKPDAKGMQAFLKPLADAMGAVTEYRNSKRGSKEWDHLSTVSEGVAAFGWVAIEPTPAPFAMQSRAGAEFYSNKLLKLYKGKDEEGLGWVNNFIGFLKGMEGYIKDHHRTGVTFSGTGEAKSAAGGSAPAAAAAPKKTAGGPPPPMPKGPLTTKATAGGSDKPAARAGLFAELNQGGKVTGHLKKVTRDMQTHKNKALRAGGVVKAAPAKKVTHRGIPTGTAKGPVLEGNKWVIEFIHDGGVLELEPDVRHSVYVYGVVNTVIKINSKTNQITLDSCKKVSVVCTDIVGGIEVVNANGVQVQVLGKAPTISVEKTSGAQVYVSKEGLGVEIITAKSDSVNVHVPKADGEFDEQPIPEQFKTLIVNGKLETNEVDHSD